MSAATRVYRPTLSEHEITAVIEVLQYQLRTNGLDLLAKAAMVKFQKLAVDFEHNTRAPSYVATGVKKQSAVNLTALGATPEELALAKLSKVEMNNVKVEFYEYQGAYGIDLPLSRFIGKTSEEVRMEELNASDRHTITDVEILEPDPAGLALFGKL